MINTTTKMLQNPMNSTNKILSNCKVYRKMTEIRRTGDPTKKIPEAIIWAMATRQDFVMLAQDGKPPKFEPRWRGPFAIKHRVGRVTYILEQLKGKLHGC
ncbi:hypothetical protein C8034_v006893 [Colletotrichum sidae]|uniref:Uncharacterized protein n=1 Tax=Colletotrichum sidae TaxID=1347389 RepID=A0A4R8T8Z4_9PEZI|nr:hypothetical protein C8034_v006893 [Colletotrichum sidae]